MHLKEANFIFLDHYDVSEIQRIIDSSKLDWGDYDFRQRRFTDHSETKTIPLIWSEKFDGIQKWKPFDFFESEILAINKILGTHLDPKGELITAILINLPAGKSIRRHRDANYTGQRFNLCNRLHLPIKTNPLCIFEIDGEEKNLKEGELWEISNVKKLHSVRNGGGTDRIHLLLDWVPSEVGKNFFNASSSK